eukprot:m.251636 g.251636  ORF g.251636 m.251636 type:complete len:75 (-) comp66189_c0_seq1:18-242(-)
MADMPAHVGDTAVRRTAPVTIATEPSEAGHGTTKQDLLARRRVVTSRAQSVSYENTGALMVVRGDGAYLMDETA